MYQSRYMGFYPKDSEQYFAANAVIFINSVELNINGSGHLMYDSFLVHIYCVILLTCYCHFSLVCACIYIVLPASNYLWS